MTNMFRWTLILCLATASLAALDWVPNQMIIKTSQPCEITRGALGMQQLDDFLQQREVTRIEPVGPGDRGQWFVATFEQPLDWNALMQQRPAMQGVEYIQPNYLNEFYATPNDPYFINQQFGLVNLPDAWDITTGSDEVIVAVIDSGLYFDHPDLQQHIFYNTGEIADNGIDDDGNGYIDDWRGWDFADAPEISGIALGDYLVEDNDPTDENKHGTHVTGIIAADSNNNTGICGAMWNVKVLVIRAGFRTTQGSGYLQDDDCAAALMYAADMGADVVNMSWGDTNYSQIIDDACQYAYDKGVILVASAGNDAASGVSYPAHLASTIAVGAVTSQFLSSGYSAGPELDVMAPGSSVLSTWDPESVDQYSEQSGTSMAAPFVTGIVGLLLSNDPSMTFEQVRTRLASTAYDLGDDGFDNTFGWGVVDAYAALHATEQPTLVISFPPDNAGLSSSFDVVGTADCDNFFRYNIMYTTEEEPLAQDWLDIVNHTNTPTFYESPVTEGVLGRFDFEQFQPDGAYELRIQMTDANGNTYEAHRNFFIDQTPPVLADSVLQVYRRYDAELSQFYLEANYDEDVSLHGEVVASNGVTYDVYSDNADTRIIIPLPHSLPDGAIDVRVDAQNRSGLTAKTGWHDDIAVIDHNSVGVNAFEQTVVDRPMLCLPPHEPGTFVAMTIVDTSSYGPVGIYHLQGQQFIELYNFGNRYFKPLAVGDTNGENLEVLGLRLSTATLYESADSASYPSIPRINVNNAMGGTLADYNGDGHDDLILVRNLSASRAITLYDRQIDAFNEKIDILNPTPTEGRNDIQPTVLVEDFDRDGVLDMLAGDDDGDVLVYELYDGGMQTELVWSLRLPVEEAFHLAKGDFNGDRHDEFCVGGSMVDESDANKTYWFFGFFKATGDNSFAMYDWLMFDQVEGQNCITAANIDDDAEIELLFSLEPNLYIIDNVDGKMTPVWKGESNRSFQSILFPKTEHAGMAAIVNVYNSDERAEATLVQLAAPFTGPPTPQGFAVQPVDEQSVRLSWRVGEATSYRIYRRETGQTGSELVDETTGDSYQNSHLETGVSYEFCVTAIDNNYDPDESLPTLWKEATPNHAPSLQSCIPTSANRLSLTFDRALHGNSLNTGHFEVDRNMGRPLSVILSDQDTRLTLTFDQAFPAVSGVFTLQIKDLQGSTGVAFPNQEVTFSYAGDFEPPEVMEVIPHREGLVELRFNETLASVAGDVACYTLLPPPVDRNNQVVSVSLDGDTVTLQLASKLQVSNQPYFLSLDNIVDLSGNGMRNDDDRLRFSMAEIRNLDHVKIAPNPLYTSVDEEIRFFDLPLGRTGKLWIYNLAGDLVYEEAIDPLNETDYFVSWDARNSISQPVSSGCYFYIIEMDGNYKKGTISVIR